MSADASSPGQRAGITVAGRLRPPPLGRVGRALIYGTGLFLLRPLLLLCHALVGWHRPARAAWKGSLLEVSSELRLLGHLLREESERLPASRVVSVAAIRTAPPEPLVVGALALAFGLIWGLSLVADGIYGRSAGLVGLGLLCVVLGLAVDLGVFFGLRCLPGLDRHGVLIRTTDGRRLAIDAVAPEIAKKFSKLPIVDPDADDSIPVDARNP